MILSLLLAVILGGLIGLEREISGKPAGLRTNILIALGAAMFALISEQLGAGLEVDPNRVVAAIITGVGFIGAGSILHRSGGTSGLTTASGIWLTAGIGIACGLGFFGLATTGTLLALLVLLGLHPFESWLQRRSRGAAEERSDIKAANEALKRDKFISLEDLGKELDIE